MSKNTVSEKTVDQVGGMIDEKGRADRRSGKKEYHR